MLISEGMSRREIARRMVISESTVRNHINAMVKMVGIRHGGRAGLKIANWVWEQRSHGMTRKEPRNDTENTERRHGMTRKDTKEACEDAGLSRGGEG